MSAPRDTLDLNVDMGESYGRWRLGDDAALMPLISSANIACGFHAGDPGTMRRTVRLALEHDVAIGAHVALPDLLGFGRRRIAMTPEEIRDDATYQIGALAAICAAEGGALAHVKPHGALYAMCSGDPEHAGAMAAAIADVDSNLLLFLMDPAMALVVKSHGVRFVQEAFGDLEYEPNGSLVIEPVKRAWDPERVARRVVRIARERRIDARDGSDLDADAPTVCLHGDAPNAAAVARAVRQALRREGIVIAALDATRARA